MVSSLPLRAEHFPYLNPDFAAMKKPALVVAGDADQSALIQRLTLAYLRAALGRGDADWTREARALAGGGARLGRLEGK